jgi:putative ABC transport system ATP-binding protein
MISLVNIERSYQVGGETVHALRGVSVHIAKNEYVSITGTSGSGKSTLVNIIGCLDVPNAGSYSLNGRDVSGMTDDELALTRNAEIGFIFQSFHLLPRLTALDNVAQLLIYRRIPIGKRKQMAQEALEQVGLGARMHHRPNELSGGQRQRVAIARALVGRPAILLADEPTGNLDSATSHEIMGLIGELHSSGQTVVIVTHEPQIANYSSRIIRMKDGQVISDVLNGQARSGQLDSFEASADARSIQT